VGPGPALPDPGHLVQRPGIRRARWPHGSNEDHRRVPPAELLLAAAAEDAEVPLIHYDRDYARIAAVSDLEQVWLVPDGPLA
jgi:predicted nucleic acid-binding protein